MTELAFTALALALLPCFLFLRNRGAFRPPFASPNTPGPLPAAISVLIPARNEAENIGPALDAVLASRHVSLEVLVLDDSSEDHTASIVRQYAARDHRVRLVTPPALPPGWCGKQHACHILATQAAHPLLCFMDADVRLHPHALARLATTLHTANLDLLSGFPRQIACSPLERLLIPLIHFVLLGYLSLRRMRASRHSRWAAGCGQLFLARAAAYWQSGGHAAIRETLHDGVRLPRSFRERGFTTDIVDATEIASCRMYHSASEVWNGLGKNATEGLGSPRLILPATILLAGGHLVPWLLLLFWPKLSALPVALALCAITASLLPRFLAVHRFHQTWTSALAHPAGVALLLVIQWEALFRSFLRRPRAWKGRAYTRPATVACCLALSLCPAAFGAQAPAIHLPDQYKNTRKLEFPRPVPTVLTVADHEGSTQVPAWVRPLAARYGSRIAIEGLADMAAVPGPLRPFVRKSFREKFSYPVMLDWDGTTTRHLRPVPKQATVLLIDTKGEILLSLSGPPSAEKLKSLYSTLDRLLGKTRDSHQPSP